MAKQPAPLPVSTGFWLFKSEPDAFSWAQQKERGAKGEPWTGVRNFLARNNMRAMQLGDLGFFYHSNIGLEIVGVVKCVRWPIPIKPTIPESGCALMCAPSAICPSLSASKP